MEVQNRIRFLRMVIIISVFRSMALSQKTSIINMHEAKVVLRNYQL